MWEHGFRGMKLEFRSAPPVIVLQAYPSGQKQPDVVAAELFWLASLGAIHWYERDVAPSGLRMRPSRLIATAGKVRVLRDWSNRQYCLNEALVFPSVKYGDIDECLQPLSPGAFMVGVDFQECFLHWLVAPECRRFPGARHPVWGLLGVYLFLHCGLGP